MSATKIRAGDRFGGLEVLSRRGVKNNRSAWLCRCDCGREAVVGSGELSSGDTQSCGCIRRFLTGMINREADLTGQKFSRLLVVGRTVTKRGSGAWICECDCGKKSVVVGYELRSGKTRSCGCYRNERIGTASRRYTPLESAKRSALRLYRNGASDRGLSWELTDAEFFDITSRDCHYCSAKPVEVSASSRKGFGDYFANGMDRLNSAIGYVIGNVVPCCSPCNHAKRSQSPEQFIARCAAVAAGHTPTNVTPAYWFKRGARFLRRAA